MSQEPDQGDDNLDLSALEAAVANLGLDDDETADEPQAPNAAPGLDLTEAPSSPPEDGGGGVSVFDAPGLPDGIEVPDFSGASLVGSAAELPDPDPSDDPGEDTSSDVPPPPPAEDDEFSATDALRDLGQDAEVEDPDDDPMVSLPAPDPVEEPSADDVMIDTFTAQGGRVKGPLKAVKGLFGR